jgi:hypothetical protein
MHAVDARQIGQASQHRLGVEYRRSARVGRLRPGGL